MILCIGEILIDMIGTYQNNVVNYERNAGGAPFNVACAIHKFGGDVGFIGSVGDDIFGRYLKDFAEQIGFSNCNIHIDEKKNTTLAFVEIDVTGERSFSFFRNDTADAYLPILSKDWIIKTDIVHIGSLMLSNSYGMQYALDVIHLAKKYHKLVSFDINYRSDVFKNEEEALQCYKKIIEYVDILKISEEEINIFNQEYIDSLKDTLVCISRGSKGSKWCYQGKSGCVPTISIIPIDTTGAGDAFYAGVLTKLNKSTKEDWTENFLTEALKFANVCGSLNTLGRGAIANLPSLDTILEYLK